MAARQFTAHIDLGDHLATRDLVKALNGLLRWPDNLRHAVVLRAADVAANWDAWRSAISKVYRYDYPF